MSPFHTLTWKDFPKSQFLLSECLATLTDDGAWLTISKLIHPDDSQASREDPHLTLYLLTFLVLLRNVFGSLCLWGWFALESR